MSTLIHDPEWLENSPACTYSLTAFDLDGMSAQEVDLTLEEYDSLKTHLAQLRGLIPEEIASVSRPESVVKAVEPQGSETDKSAQSWALRFAIQALDHCTSIIESQRLFLPTIEKESPEHLAEALADTIMLENILSRWYDSQLDAGLQASIRANLELLCDR